MLDPASGVQVYIRPYDSYDDENYKEYKTLPERERHVEGTNSRYIGAETNKRFTIAVDLPKSFEFEGTGGVKVECCIYSVGSIHHPKAGTRIYCSATCAKQWPTLQTGRFNFDSFTAWDPERKIYRSYGFRWNRAALCESSITPVSVLFFLTFTNSGSQSLESFETT